MANIHRTVCEHCNASVEISWEGHDQPSGRCPSCDNTVDLSYSASENPTDDFGPRNSEETDEYIPGADPAKVNKWSRVIPNSIGRFEVLGWLGSGGYGDVYLCFEPKLKRKVALKVLREERVDERRKRRFLKEAEAAAQLDHEGIVRVWEIGCDDGKLWIALELVEGHSLADEIKDRGILPPHRAVELAIQMADALAYAHSKGITHRDVKPANVLLNERGRVKITDLGLARRMDVESGMTETRAVIGSVDYMAPEQASGLSREADGRTDIFGLGVVMFEMLTGQVPRAVIRRFQEKGKTPPDPLTCRSILPSVPAELDAICRKAMEIDPKNRHASMAELAAELRGWLQNRSLSASSSQAEHPTTDLQGRVQSQGTTSHADRSTTEVVLPQGVTHTTPARVSPRGLGRVAAGVLALGSLVPLGYVGSLMLPPSKPKVETAAETPVVATVAQKARFIGNNNSKTVHYVSCKHATMMSDQNRVEFKTLDDAKARGFKSCSSCHPDRHDSEVARVGVD